MKKIIIAILVFVTSCSYLPEEEALGGVENVREETGDYILLSASDDLPEKAFLFVPGGLVDPHVYLCWMDKFVEQNPDIAIIALKIPSNLAILNMSSVMKGKEQFPEIGHWAIGGHSLGGVVSSGIIAKHPDDFESLILLASYTTDFADLSNWQGSVLSISASNDALSTPADIQANKQYLPPETTTGPSPGNTYYVEIEGGNHSNFGCYGDQKGDAEADISIERQQELLLQTLTTYFNSLW